MSSQPEQEATEPLERRTALRWLIRGFLSLWGLGAAAVGISFLKVPSEEKRPTEGMVRGGSFSTLRVGKARFIRHGTRPIFVVRVSENEVQAFPAVCTHLRCILEWDQEQEAFLCPCHHGAFDRNGNVLSGPPTRPLVPYRTEVRADEVIIHT